MRCESAANCLERGYHACRLINSQRKKPNPLVRLVSRFPSRLIVAPLHRSARGERFFSRVYRGYMGRVADTLSTLSGLTKTSVPYWNVLLLPILSSAAISTPICAQSARASQPRAEHVARLASELGSPSSKTLANEVDRDVIGSRRREHRIGFMRGHPPQRVRSLKTSFSGRTSNASLPLRSRGGAVDGSVERAGWRENGEEKSAKKGARVWRT